MSERVIVSPAGTAAPVRSLKHELRTPLNHIIGYCEMLIEEAQDRRAEVLVPDLQRIHTAGRHLLRVINDLFDPAKSPACRTDGSQLDHEVRTPINQIIGYAELLQEQAQQNQPPEFVEDLGKICAAARRLLQRILEQFDSGFNEVVLPAIAVPSYAAPVSDRASGRAEALSVSASSNDSLMPASRILAVDDDAPNRDMLLRRLGRLGHHVSLAENAWQALEILRREPFDLVLLDIQMPDMNGYVVLDQIKLDPALRDLPVIMLSASDDMSRVARCIEMGAEDYLPKPFDPVLLRARIHACLEKRQLRERERQAFEALQRSQKALSDELAEAAAYVRSLLPAPLETGPVRAAWRFLPSSQLGGDAFGYYWLDERHFAFHLLDVCGHGVGAALLSVSVMNVLKNRSIPEVDFADPGAVLAALNRTFQMERQNNMFFTIWYGVFSTETRELAFAGGGHPPAVLIGPEETAAQPLQAGGAIVGAFEESPYATHRRPLTSGTRLYLFSDGVYELARTDDSAIQLPEFIAELTRPTTGSKLDDIVDWASGIRAGAKFEDDVSIIELQFL